MSIGVVPVYLPQKDPSFWTAFDQPIIDTHQILHIKNLDGMNKITGNVKINDEVKNIDIYCVSNSRGWVVWEDFIKDSNFSLD